VESLIERFIYVKSVCVVMELEILQDLGFTQAEAKVYLTLLKLGAVKVGSIIEKSGLQSSTIHNTLHSLIDKGYVNYVLKGKIKIYQVTDPKLILKVYREREKRFSEIIPKLKIQQKFAAEKQQVEMYEGMKGIINMLNEFIEDTKPGDHFCFFSVDVPGINEEIQKFFERYDTKRKAKRLVVRGLAREKLRPYYKNRKLLKVRYVSHPIPANFSFCNDKMVLINWGERPTGIMIKSKQVIESQKMFFDELWKRGKK